MTKYIGIIYWNDNTTVLDNTTVSTSLQKVWKQCCQAHKIHSGDIVIRQAVFNDVGDVIGDPVIRFVDVADCIEAYNHKYNK